MNYVVVGLASAGVASLVNFGLKRKRGGTFGPLLRNVMVGISILLFVFYTVAHFIGLSWAYKKVDQAIDDELQKHFLIIGMVGLFILNVSYW